MLYDPKQGVRAQWMNFRNWLAGRPADGQYNWRSQEDCLVCQYYGEAWGRALLMVDRDFGGTARMIEVAQGDGQISSWTYGQARERVERVLVELGADEEELIAA